MAQQFPAMEPAHMEFIRRQHMFFVATAPLSPDHHVNVSPKGQDVFRILSPNRVAYLDLTGSGNETSAHLQENGRITFMFCAFAGAPQILRLYGQGRVILPNQPEWAALVVHFEPIVGMRQIILADIDLVQTSCGFAVPLYDFVGQRDVLAKWASRKGGQEGMREYWKEKNVRSIDGLPTPLGQMLSE